MPFTGRSVLKHFMVLLLGLSALGGCRVALADEPAGEAIGPVQENVQEQAQEPPNEGGLDPDNLPAEMDMTLEQLLNDPDGVAPMVDATRCLGRVRSYQTVILDDEHLLFKSSTGRRAWLNRMTNKCVGLRPSMVLVFRSTGSRRCALDSVHGVESGGFGIQSARCMLGKFEPITMEHALALEDSFEKRSRALAESRRQERRAARAERKQKRREAREAKRQARAAAGQ